MHHAYRSLHSGMKALTGRVLIIAGIRVDKRVEEAHITRRCTELTARKDDSIHAHLLPCLAWKSINCIWGRPHCLLHNSSKKHHAGLVYQRALLPASLLLQPMADSGHRPREATPLDFGPRPAPPRGKRRWDAQARAQIGTPVAPRFFSNFQILKTNRRRV